MAEKTGSGLRVTILSDNNGTERLAGEWGLSVLIERDDGLRVLLDAGASDLFIKNARALGKSLAGLDAAVLSHAHHDHADGFPALLREQPELKVFVRRCAGACCYAEKEDGLTYIGAAPELFSEYGDRLARVDGDREIAPGVWLIAHRGADGASKGARERMFVKDGEGMRPDDFAHEQSLVFDTERGLCIFNSCSHAGAAEIVEEVRAALPGREVYAYVGGFHLYQKTPEEVAAFAERLKDAGVERICTGHCTGEEAFAVLKERLGDRLTQFRVGLELEL